MLSDIIPVQSSGYLIFLSSEICYPIALARIEIHALIKFLHSWKSTLPAWQIRYRFDQKCYIISINFIMKAKNGRHFLFKVDEYMHLNVYWIYTIILKCPAWYVLEATYLNTKFDTYFKLHI